MIKKLYYKLFPPSPDWMTPDQRQLIQPLSDTKDPRNSDEPWIELKSTSYDETKGIRLQLDWNPAFIEYLKSKGITGVDEDTIMQKYLAQMYDNISADLQARSFSQSDERPSEYV